MSSLGIYSSTVKKLIFFNWTITAGIFILSLGLNSSIEFISYLTLELDNRPTMLYSGKAGILQGKSELISCILSPRIISRKRIPKDQTSDE